MPRDTEVSNLIINKLSKEQYQSLVESGQVQENELYVVSDDTEYATIEELATKQDATDDNLVTLDKTVVGAVNELESKIRDIQLFKFPDATIIGEPTINNGQISNFSSSNYLILPFAFDTKDRAFEINMAFTTGSNVSSNQNLLGGNYCIALLLEGGVLKFRASNNGTGWNVADITTDLTVQPNTNYFVKVVFNKLNYTIYYSTNGEDYTQIGYLVSTLFPCHGQVLIGVGNNLHNPFQGIINLNKANIKLNNSIVWQGMDDAGLATRADISLSNLDELGQAKFDAKQDVIDDTLTTDSKALVGAINELKSRIDSLEQLLSKCYMSGN